MVLKEKLIKALKEFEKENKILTVAWNGGGDETFVNYYLDGEHFTSEQIDFFEELTEYLVVDFDIPNAGEHFSEGDGKFLVEDQNRIVLLYNEMTHFEDFEDFEEILAEEYWINVDSKLFFERVNIKEIKFYGSIELFDNELQYKEAELSDINLSQQQLEDIKAHLTKTVIEQFDSPFGQFNTEIEYAGILFPEKILLEEISIIETTLEKDDKQVKKYLFE